MQLDLAVHQFRSHDGRHWANTQLRDAANGRPDHTRPAIYVPPDSPGAKDAAAIVHVVVSRPRENRA